MRSPPVLGDDRADSEVIGFAFVFAMAILSVLVVTVTGYGGLADLRDAERVENAAGALDVLADNVDDVVYRGAPSRSTELHLTDATLGFGEPSGVRVLVDGTERARYDLRPLVYDADTGSRLVYVDGAVLREDRGGVVMLREPALRADSEEVSLTIVSLSPASTSEGTSGATANVRTTRTGVELVVAETGGHTVTYEITSPYADAWERSLEASFGGCTRAGDTVSCTVATERVYVTVVDVAVRYD